MSSINVPRMLAGGLVAALLLWLIEGAASALYLNEMMSVLRAHGLRVDVTSTLWVMSILLSVLLGQALLFIYAAARPRFGPGPRTAALVAVVFWIGGYIPALIGYGMIGLYPGSMLFLWGVVGLLEMIIATIAGAWVYREPLPAVP